MSLLHLLNKLLHFSAENLYIETLLQQCFTQMTTCCISRRNLIFIPTQGHWRALLPGLVPENPVHSH